MTTRHLPTIAALGLLLVAGRMFAQGEAPAASSPLVAPLPGIAAEDRQPNGCVDCHRNYVDLKMDQRLSTLMAGFGESVRPDLLAKAQAAAPAGATLQGRHPKVNVAANVPGKCLNCHRRDSEMAPPFTRLMHAIHLTGGEDNPFASQMGGACSSCHKLDAATGQWRIPTGPEE
ncbi:MAG: cytochrome c3 family protein [Candidatus Delongbacteria bacterium]